MLNMLASVACSCVRTGWRASVPAAQLFRAVRSGTGAPGVIPAASPRRLPSALTARAASLTRGAPSAPEGAEGFGDLSADLSSRRRFRKSNPETQDLEEEEEEEEAGRAVRRPGRRNTPYWYFLQCKKLIKDNKLQEALDLFGRDMLRGEGLQPEEFNYTVLIGGCGRAGRLREAFRLYNDMKKRGLGAVDATYTALFNACAQSPSSRAGLQQALKLEQELRRKNYALSTVTYHALLKAHAVTNHLEACVHTLREMLQNGHVVTQETFHHLLMGCLTDREAGFRLALQVWRQMLKSGLLPDAKNYNLLLRTARDCGIGDPVLANDVLLRPERGLNVKSGCGDAIDVDLLERQLFVRPESSGRGVESTHLVPLGQNENASPPAAPNLLDLFEGGQGDVVSLGTVGGASDRLALIGGAEGILEKMAADGSGPDLRTLTLLADTMEPGRRSLQTLLRAAKQHRVKLDVAFFNSAIRSAARAGDLEAAKGVLSVMRQRHVSVDVQTFGSLALGCERQEDGLQLLQDMQGAGLRPNVQVFSALIGRAARRLDYVYLKTLLKSMRDMRVWPNEVIIRQLEFAAQYPPNYNQYKSRNNYLVQINGFRGYYQQWLRAMPAQGAGGEEAQLQNDPDAAEPRTDAADGLTRAQRNQRASARRYFSRNRDKTSGTAA